MEDPRLCEAVLAGGGVEDEQALVGSARDLALDHAPQLGHLAHQVRLRVQPPGRVDDRDIDPALLRQRVALTRYPPTPALAAVIDRFWAVRWKLPEGACHRQQVLTHPGANASVGHANAMPGAQAPGPVEARMYGVARVLTTRVLVGTDWTVAAMLRPGGLGAFVSGSAASLTDRVVSLGEAIGCDDPAVVTETTRTEAERARVAVLASALQRALAPARVPDAVRVTEVARLAETSREVRRLADLCAASGFEPRRLQRLFLRFAGVSPTWVIRRYRLLEAAESVREGEPVSQAQQATAHSRRA